jgi:hypothetical protein
LAQIHLHRIVQDIEPACFLFFLDFDGRRLLLLLGSLEVRRFDDLDLKPRSLE